MEQAVPLQPMGPTWSRSPRCSPPMGGGAPGGAGGCGLEEAAAHGEPPQEQAPGRSCSHGEEPPQEQGGWGELPPSRGGPVLEQFAPGGWMDGWSPWDGAVWEQCLRSCCLWAARVGSAGEGRHPMGGTPRGAGAGRDPEGHSAESALPVTILVEPSPCPYLSPGALCIVFSPPFPLRRGSERAAVVELGCPPALNHRSCKVLGKISFKKLNKVFNKEMQSFLLKASWRIGLLSYSQLRGRELLISPSFF